MAASPQGTLLFLWPRYAWAVGRITISPTSIIAPEIAGSRIGAAVLKNRLVDVLLVLVLRAALEQAGGGDDAAGVGWIGALADPHIGKALRRMHADAAYPWTLGRLGADVAMSRSAFARRFRALVGQAPLDYLLGWRMRIARDRLRRGSTVAAAALAVGYASESAFRHAFKRRYGHPPKRDWGDAAVEPRA